MRAYWVDSLVKIACPVLDALSRERLREEMPVESVNDIDDRKTCTYLEALGRTLCGLAPGWSWKGWTDKNGKNSSASVSWPGRRSPLAWIRILPII